MENYVVFLTDCWVLPFTLKYSGIRDNMKNILFVAILNVQVIKMIWNQ